MAEWAVFVSHVFWRFRHREILREAKQSGHNVDDLLAKKDNTRPSSVEEGVSQVEEPVASPDTSPSNPVVTGAIASEKKI